MIQALIVMAVAMVMAAAGWSWSPADLAPAGAMTPAAGDAYYTFFRQEMDCNPRAREGCAGYALAALQEAIPGLTWTELAAVVVQTEFGTVWTASTRATIAELVWRRFFDPQTGACPWDAGAGRYACSEATVLRWLSTWQGVTDAVMIGEGHAEVNVARLTGVRDCPAVFCQGYRRFVDYLGQAASEHLETWRTGLGPRVPSASGLFCLQTGGQLLGTFFARQIVGECEGGDLYWLIVGTGNRHAVWSG